MDLLQHINDLVAAANQDADKFYNKKNKAAGTRLRAKMLELKKLASDVRKEVSEIKNA